MSTTATDRTLAVAVASGLAQALRDEGLPVSVVAVTEFARALLAIGSIARSTTYWAGRAIFVASPEDIPEYDAAFTTFFESYGSKAGATTGLGVSPTEPSRSPSEDVGPDGDVTDDASIGLSFSDAERLARADLTTLSREERAQVLVLIAQVAHAEQRAVTRRYRSSRREKERLDLRRSVARQLRTDGELIDRRYRARRRRSRRVVVLCDISGSMAPYATAMLQLAYALLSGRTRVEVFAFGTRLTRLTRALRHRDLEAAFSAAEAEVQDWSGGTRLGETLRTFNDRFGIPGAARAATVIICSDGIDRGEPGLVATQMARLDRVARRIIWVNPLKSSPGYEPLARGMAAALPFVDEFLPGDSLAALAATIQAIDA